MPTSILKKFIFPMIPADGIRQGMPIIAVAFDDDLSLGNGEINRVRTESHLSDKRNSGVLQSLRHFLFQIALCFSYSDRPTGSRTVFSVSKFSPNLGRFSANFAGKIYFFLERPISTFFGAKFANLGRYPFKFGIAYLASFLNSIFRMLRKPKPSSLAPTGLRAIDFFYRWPCYKFLSASQAFPLIWLVKKFGMSGIFADSAAKSGIRPVRFYIEMGAAFLANFRNYLAKSSLASFLPSHGKMLSNFTIESIA